MADKNDPCTIYSCNLGYVEGKYVIFCHQKYDFNVSKTDIQSI